MELQYYLDRLAGTGFYYIMLLFLVVFVIVLALLEQLMIFGNKSEPRVELALAVAAFVSYFARDVPKKLLGSFPANNLPAITVIFASLVAMSYIMRGIFSRT